jgi:hypothetical protein
MAEVQLPWGAIIEFPDPATPEEAERQRKLVKQFREGLRRGKTHQMQEAQERELERRERR